MNYAEEQLLHAIENELEAIKLRNKELVLENENLSEGRDILNQRLDIAYADNKQLRNDNEEYKLANISLGNFRQKLENEIDKQKSYISELEYQSMEQSKTECSLREIIDNYRKGIEDSNVQLAEFNGKEEKLKTEIANLKQLLKAVTYLL